MRRKLYYLVLSVALAAAALTGPLAPAAQATNNCYTVCTYDCGSPCCTFCCHTPSGLVCHHQVCAC
jgi:hypothetical protein